MKGQADLRVDLGQPARKRAEVKRAVLEAAGAEQAFVGRRLERLFGDVHRLVAETCWRDPPRSGLGQQRATLPSKKRVATWHRSRSVCAEGRGW